MHMQPSQALHQINNVTSRIYKTKTIVFDQQRYDAARQLADLAYYAPNTPQDEQEIYTLALHTDAEHQERMDALCTRYYPIKSRGPAHVALFRNLPGSLLSTIESDVSTLCQQQRPFAILADNFSLRPRGIMILVGSPRLRDIWASLRKSWLPFLSKKDTEIELQGYNVQNNVSRTVRREAVVKIKKEFQGSRGWVDGLTMWRHTEGARWTDKDFMFPPSTMPRP